jgi:hypothetical protein
VSDLVVAASVTRTELGLGDLNLHVAGSIQVVSYDPSGAVKSRVLAGSPTLDGHVQTGSKVDGRVILLTLRVLGPAKSVLDATAQTIFNAFEQSSYQLTVQLDDATVVWQCDDAEYKPVSADGDGVDKTGLAQLTRRQAFAFTIPAQPAPVSGVY